MSKSHPIPVVASCIYFVVASPMHVYDLYIVNLHTSLESMGDQEDPWPRLVNLYCALDGVPA